MKLRRKLGVAAFVCGALFFGCRSCKPVNGSAADTTRTLTPAQTRALLGDTLTFTYYNGTDYVQGTMQYATNQATITNANLDFQYAYRQRDLFNQLAPQGTQYLIYYATLPDIYGTDLRATVELQPTIQFSGVSIARMVGGFSVASDYSPRTSTAPYNCVSYYVNGNRQENHNFYSDASRTVSGYTYDMVFPFFLSNQQRYFALAPVYFESTDSTAYIDSIQFTEQSYLGTDVNNHTIRFIVSCPTISADSGSIGSTSGGGTIGTDLEATNRKLDVIIQLLNQIAENTENDDDSSYDSPSQLIVMPVWLDAALLNHEATFDIDIDGSIIFGLTPEHSDNPAYPTAGGQVFLPSESGVDRIAADPSNGGVLQGMGLWSTLLKSLLGTNPLMSKLITMFLGLSVVTWLLYYRKGG